jgi:hypothetical protein
MNKLSPSEALATRWRIAEWDEYLSNLSFDDFNDLYRGVLDGVEEAARKNDFAWLLTLLATISQKWLRFGHFEIGLTDEQREWAIQNGELLMQYVMSMLANNKDKLAAVTAAWNEDKKYCQRFGYLSGPVFETLPPQKLFRN